MNSQTKSALKAALIGLAISIGLAAVHAVNEGRISPIDPYAIFNPEVIANWVGKVGGIPLLFVLGTIAFSFRKTAIWISMLNLVGAVVALTLAITIGVVVLAAAYPVKQFPFASAGADRDAFVRDGIAHCINRQRGLPQNQGASDDLIRNFCSCYTNAAADATTREDIEYQSRYGTMSDSEKEKLTTAYKKCAPNAQR